MDKVETLQNSASALSGEKLVSFIEAFYRIIKVGIYYPTGHIVLDQAASKCIQQLQDISPSLQCAKIKVLRNKLLVEKIQLPTTSIPVKEFHLLLSKLGIHSIEIEKSISLQQLLAFIKNLLSWRMQLESTQAFIGFNVTDIPDTIRVEQQEFFVDETSILHEDADNDSRQNLENLCKRLGEQGLTTQQVAQCRVFIEKLSEPSEGKHQEIKGFPNATWHDVQALLYQIATGDSSLEEHSSESTAGSDINVISSIFKGLEQPLSDKKSKETINLLISHLTGRSTDDHGEVEKKAAKPKKKLHKLLDDDQKISVNALKTFIHDNSFSLEMLEHVTIVDRSEEMSILLQLISSDSKKQLRENLEQELKTILAGMLTDREKDVLISGIKHIADSEDVVSFRHLLSVVLQTLRGSESLNSLDFVVDLWRKMPYAMHILLWPFIVNELLIVGMEENRERFREATEIACHMHLGGMKKLRSQLEEMDAFQKKRVARSIFCPTYIFSYKLFAFLIETSLGDIIAEKILTGLLDAPQDPLFKAVGPLLNVISPTHLKFLHAYLAQANLKEPPLALKMAAGQIILEYLRNTSEETRALPWLEKAIAATTWLNVKGMEVMLCNVVNDKRLGVLPVWPRSCRIAADAALKVLKRQSLGELL